MKARRLVHVLKGIPNPDTLNGVNKVVHHLASEQQASGVDVQVWAVGDDGASADYPHTYPLRQFSLTRSRFLLERNLLAALDACPDDTLFHLHSVFVPELYAVSRQLRLQGRPWVISPHGGYAPASRRKNALLKRPYMALFERHLIAGAAAIHAIGHFGEVDQFEGTRHGAKVGLVPNGQDLLPVQRQDYSAEGPLKLVFCGRLAVAHKGLDLLLAALEQVRRDGVSVELVLIGDGAERQMLERLARRPALEGAVDFRGARLGEDKLAMLLEGDVFVHTSRWDVIPTAALEAAALGLPLLITRPTNLATFVAAADAGYVVPELSVEAIASQLRQAAANKREGRLEAKGRAARRMIGEQFAWARIADRLEEQVYQRALPLEAGAGSATSVDGEMALR